MKRRETRERRAGKRPRQVGSTARLRRVGRHGPPCSSDSACGRRERKHRSWAARVRVPCAGREYGRDGARFDIGGRAEAALGAASVVPFCRVPLRRHAAFDGGQTSTHATCRRRRPVLFGRKSECAADRQSAGHTFIPARPCTPSSRADTAGEFFGGNAVRAAEGSSFHQQNRKGRAVQAAETVHRPPPESYGEKTTLSVESRRAGAVVGIAGEVPHLIGGAALLTQHLEGYGGAVA